MWLRFSHRGIGGAVAAVFLTLAGCGFHPAGQVSLPAVMASTYLQSPSRYGYLENTLRRELTQNGVKVVDSRATSTATLDIMRTRVERRLLAVNRLGQPVQYMLIYRVRYRLLDANGQVLVPAEWIRLQRTYAYSVQTELAVGQQTDALLAAVQRTASRLILLRLRLYHRHQVTSKPSHTQI